MQIRDLLEKFLDACLKRKDPDTGLELVSENVIVVGKGECRGAAGKDELKALLEREFREIRGEIRYEIREYTETVFREDLAGALCRVILLADRTDQGQVAWETRLTAVAVREKDRWRFINIHASVPEKRQKEQWLFPLKYSRYAVGTIGEKMERQLVQMMSSFLPGGVMGVYPEKNLPLYVINDTLLRHLGYTYRQLEEETGEQGILLLAPEDRDSAVKEIRRQLRDRGEYEIQYRMVRRDGSYFWALGKGNEMTTEDGRKAIISVVLDISKSIGIQEKLKREAMEDGLTGVLNRKGALHFLKRSLEERDTGTMFLMDIDNFKNMNDTFGHMAGDGILVSLGNILRQNTRQGDVVSRMGGDEFMVYLCGCTRRDIVRERVEAISGQFRKAGEAYREVDLSVSTGIAVRERGESFEELYRRADDALYRVKNSRKGGYAFWEE